MMAVEPEYSYEARVKRWVDGDSLWMTVVKTHALDNGFRNRTTVVNEHDMEFRLYGCDAPDRGKPGRAEATAFVNERWPVGSVVKVRTYKPRKQDRYKRYLVQIIEGDGRTSDEVLIAAGHAVPYFGGRRS